MLNPSVVLTKRRIKLAIENVSTKKILHAASWLDTMYACSKKIESLVSNKREGEG